MTDNEIKQALPFLAKYCKDEYNDIRVDEVLLGAFDIINRQQATIEKSQTALFKQEDTMQIIAKEKQQYFDELQTAKAEIDRYKKYCSKCGKKTTKTILQLQEIIAEKRAEIERLQKENTELDGANVLLTVTLKNAQSEAIKEFLNKFDIEYCKMFSANEIVFMKEFKKQFLKKLRDEQ